MSAIICINIIFIFDQKNRKCTLTNQTPLSNNLQGRKMTKSIAIFMCIVMSFKAHNHWVDVLLGCFPRKQDDWTFLKLTVKTVIPLFNVHCFIFHFPIKLGNKMVCGNEHSACIKLRINEKKLCSWKLSLRFPRDLVSHFTIVYSLTLAKFDQMSWAVVY